MANRSHQTSYESERCARLLVRNANLTCIIRHTSDNSSRMCPKMPKRNRLSVRIPLLVEAAAEGPLAVLLLFVLALAIVTIYGLA
jgi:hypothetical protein